MVEGLARHHNEFDHRAEIRENFLGWDSNSPKSLVGQPHVPRLVMSGL
jgi:hypothetical protein